MMNSNSNQKWKKKEEKERERERDMGKDMPNIYLKSHLTGNSTRQT